MRVIRSSLIAGNFATSATTPNASAGILNGNLLMLNCTVVGNRAENGPCGGVETYYAGPSITNLICATITDRISGRKPITGP